MSNEDENVLAPLDTLPVPEFKRMKTISPNDADALLQAYESVTDFNSSGITFQQFLSLCFDMLDIDLSEHELKRVFDKVDEDHSGSINFNEFKKAIENRAFFRQLFSIARSRVDFKIPADYDYTKSTNDNYAQDDKHKPINERIFVGEFAHIRRTRDYSYHVNYTPERQVWQDAAVKAVVSRSSAQSYPWIVYTCGPMGAGKGYALSWMSRNGYFPLEDIVHIDPDYFKRIMPEWKEYVRLAGEKANAGTFCHRESGYIQEIAQEVALQRYQNVWVDGSLRDGEWFSQVFADIRRRYESYRIAIFYVYASEKVVRARIKARTLETGRSISEDLIVSSLRAPDRSLNILTPLADFVARINNEGAPILEAFETIDHSHNWVVIAQKFARTHGDPREFPNNLAPLFLVQSGVKNEHMKVDPEDEKKLNDFSYRGVVNCSFQGICQTLCDDGDFCELYIKKFGDFDFELFENLISSKKFHLSPSHPVNLDPESARLANIPTDVHFFAWVHPCHISEDDLKALGVVQRSDLPSLPLIEFLSIGGFAYFSASGKLLQINALTATRQSNMLQFGARVSMTPAVTKQLFKEKRWKRATIDHITRKGVKYYAWILPAESIADQSFGIFGGFAYCFVDEDHIDSNASSQNVYFPVATI